MTDIEIRSVFETYLKAFAMASKADQEDLLRASIAEDVRYSNPGVEGYGRKNLLAHIAVFQERFTGGYFRVNWLWHQHGQLLSEWTQYDESDSAVFTAFSYAQLNQEGLLSTLAGFWALGAVS